MSLSVMLQQLASGMVVSVEIFVVTLLFSLPLGLLICFGRMSKNPAYVELCLPTYQLCVEPR